MHFRNYSGWLHNTAYWKALDLYFVYGKRFTFLQPCRRWRVRPGKSALKVQISKAKYYLKTISTSILILQSIWRKKKSVVWSNGCCVVSVQTSSTSNLENIPLLDHFCHCLLWTEDMPKHALSFFQNPKGS